MKRLIHLLAGIVIGSAIVCVTAAPVIDWTAPGNDGNVGRATQYDFRYAMTADSLTNFWSACHPVPNPPVPDTAGTIQSWDLTNFLSSLPPNITIYIAEKTRDDAWPNNNWSQLSNITILKTRDTIAPSAILIRVR